jgi:UDP-glucose 4-epimerase
MLRDYGRAHGLRFCALRYFNAAGADPEGEIGEDHSPETHLIPLILDAALGRRPVVHVFGSDYSTPDGTAIRDYIHVSDLADAHERALAYLLSGLGSTFLNVGTGRGHSVKEVLSAAERVTGRRIPVESSPRRPGDPPALVADPARAMQVLRWQPRLPDLETIVSTALRWTTDRRRSPGFSPHAPLD